MRSKGVIFFLLFAFAAHAQNWALLNPAYKYNYSLGGTDTITNQIFVTHIDTLGVDSVLQTLNPIVGRCGIGDSDYVYHIDLTTPQFLMRQCLVHDGTWIFSDTATYVFPSAAGLGATWTFRPDDNIQATIISVGTALVLGELDSVKTMVSNAADIVVWSKAHGLMHWALAGAPAYFLVGIHGPDVGHLIPSLADFYPYHAGDIVQYHAGYWANLHSSEIVNQFHITGRTDYPGSILFTGSRMWAERPMGSGMWYYGSDNAPLQVSTGSDHLMTTVSSYPGEFIAPSYFQVAYAAMVAKHGMNSDGYYEISNTSDYIFQGLTLIEVLNDSNTTCAAITWVGTPDSYWSMDTQVGLRGYLIDQLYQGESLTWEGALINGVQIGHLDSAAFFHVGISEEQAPQTIRIVPNPADDELTFQNIGGPAMAFCILNISGQTLKSGTLTPDPRQVIDVSSLPEGMYLLNVATAQGSSSQRFVIAR